MSEDDRSSKNQQYQDYVIRDGIYIGKFEEMYQNSADIPWHQDQTVHAIFSDITITILNHLKVSSALDVGCGLGYMADRCKREVKSLQRIVGIDISETAISKARRKFDTVEFIVGDIWTLSRYSEKFDIVICKDILWYVLENLSEYVQALTAKSNKWIYFGQSFPEKRPYYGEELFPDSKALISYFVDNGYKVQYSIVERDAQFQNREYVHILLEVPNDK